MPKKQEKSHAREQRGRVISYYGKSVDVETDNGSVVACHLRRNQDLPVVGDEVSWELEASDGTGIVLGILPRRSMLARADSRGRLKPIAANIDVLVIVMSPPPVFSVHMVNRYLVAAELLKIQHILVINKADLMDKAALTSLKTALDIYRDIPYPVVLSSIYVEDGCSELTALLQGKIGALVGPSGVGKSSLITALGSEEIIRVG